MRKLDFRSFFQSADWKAWYFKRSKKRRLGFFLGGIFVLSAGIYFISLAWSFWQVDQGALRLAELRRSWQKDKICHEECASFRNGTAAAVVKALASGNKAVSQLLEKYFRSDDDKDFKNEIVRLARAAFGTYNPPNYIREYFNDPSGSEDVKARIISSFSAQSLGGTSESSGADFYLSIIAGSSGVQLKLAAIRALSDFPEKENAFSKAQLTIIKKALVNPAIELKVSQALVMLLGDYYRLFPKDTEKILRTVLDDYGYDAISRTFAADILVRLGGINLSPPEVTEQEWTEYFND